MTYQELYIYANQKLKEALCDQDSVPYEVRCLISDILGIRHYDFPALRTQSPDKDDESRFIMAVERRAAGVPLQYITGRQIFMGREYDVGEGVLIPRDDTEVAVRACMSALGKNDCPKLIDLCSGSGIIPITLAGDYPRADITALELYDEAFCFLQKNIAAHHAANVKPLQADVFSAYNRFEDGCFDLIVSNPPYIRSDELSNLQTEVQCEPRSALDGGDDGLTFYRAIAELWLDKLRSGGTVVLEIGEEQAQAVSRLLMMNNIVNITVLKDIQDLDRVIIGTKK